MVKYYPFKKMSDELSPEEQLKYLRMYKTILRMLIDRGYEVDEEKRDILDQSLDEYQTVYSSVNPSQLNGTFESLDHDSSERVQVRFDINEKINNKLWTSIIERMNQDNVNHCILIVRDGTVPKNISRTVELLREKRGQRVEFFEQKEVIINITEHELVPKHEPLTPDQKKALLDRYHINDSQLPKILKTDPVVRYYGVGPGTVIKITRKSETAGRYITYRLVC